MLYKSNALNGFKLHSLDGEIGKINEFYFDDHRWTIRYLVAGTGNWLTGRQVLISPYALLTVNKEEKYISVNLTRKQIEGSPSLNSDKPVSRQFEEAYNAYYALPSYWSGPYMCGYGTYPLFFSGPDKKTDFTQGESMGDPHLRSTHHINGYHIQATDGEIGHVEDFILDDKTWAIRYLVVNTRNWWPGKRVLMSPSWIESVRWNDAKIFIHLPREAIKQSPEFTEESLPTREYETQLHRHYNRPGYWVDEPVAEKAH